MPDEEKEQLRKYIQERKKKEGVNPFGVAANLGYAARKRKEFEEKFKSRNPSG